MSETVIYQSPAYPLHADALLPALPFAAARQSIIAMAREHALPVAADSASAVTVEVPAFGHYSFTARDGGIAVRISAAMQDRLFMLKEGFALHLEEIREGASAALRWSDAAPAGASGALPPNVRFTTVRAVSPVGPAFLRVEVQGTNLESFRDDAIHFRLLLPPAGCAAPQWPHVAENGATVWPKGDAALHRPVYTTRRIDHDTGVMAFDIFLHEGGRATGWARRARPGDRLAIAGPGGGGIPETSRILLFADETALPAAARILESLPPESEGTAVFLSDKGAACGYPVQAPAGVAVTWQCRGVRPGLAEQALAAHAALPGHYLWFAGEKSEVQTLRGGLKHAKPAAANSYIAAYWSAE